MPIMFKLIRNNINNSQIILFTLNRNQCKRTRLQTCKNMSVNVYKWFEILLHMRTNSKTEIFNNDFLGVPTENDALLPAKKSYLVLTSRTKIYN